MDRMFLCEIERFSYTARITGLVPQDPSGDTFAVIPRLYPRRFSEVPPSGGGWGGRGIVYKCLAHLATRADEKGVKEEWVVVNRTQQYVAVMCFLLPVVLCLYVYISPPFDALPLCFEQHSARPVVLRTTFSTGRSTHTSKVAYPELICRVN